MHALKEWVENEVSRIGLGKPQKKVLLLMAGPLRPNPPPPSSLMAVEILERWKTRTIIIHRSEDVIYLV